MKDLSPKTHYPHETLAEIVTGTISFLTNEKILLGMFFTIISLAMAIITMFIIYGIISLDVILASGKIGIIYTNPSTEWTWKFINTSTIYLISINLSLFTYGSVMFIYGIVTLDESINKQILRSG